MPLQTLSEHNAGRLAVRAAFAARAHLAEAACDACGAQLHLTDREWYLRPPSREPLDVHCPECGQTGKLER